MDKKDLGKRIRTLRKSAKFTQLQLSERAKISNTNYQLIELGEGNPTIETLEIIGIAIESPIDIYIGKNNAVHTLKIAEKRLELVELISQIPADKLNEVIALANDFIAEAKALSVRDVPGTKPS